MSIESTPGPLNETNCAFNDGMSFTGLAVKNNQCDVIFSYVLLELQIFIWR
jgi:hypothetical protein